MPLKVDEGEGILEGISSLHSWIKTQTMIIPSKLDRAREEEEGEEVVIRLTSANPQVKCEIENLSDLLLIVSNVHTNVLYYV